jgi:hypothetical protein
MTMQCSQKFLAGRYPKDIAELSILAFFVNTLGQRQANRPPARIKGMKKDKLKSTTVRFTDSDLHLIECLQEKLGLGMVHVIRLAIRRLAENEGLLPSNSAFRKR